MITVKRFNELTLDELYEIIKLRINVFVVEQSCPYPDLDDIDQDAYHIFLRENNEIVGYCRVIDKGNRLDYVSIGRVISKYRGKYYGLTVLKEGIRIAKEKFNANVIKIGAQKYAIGFYEKVGFKVVSDDYLEDGIPHVYMILEL